MRRSSSPARPLAAGLAAGALLLALVTAGAATAAEPVPGARDTSQWACPPDEVPESGFTDTEGNIFGPEIDCLAWYGITTGGPGGRPADEYGPRLAVRRDQMASFIARTLDYVDQNILGPGTGENEFRDVDDDSPHVSAINRLANAGIVLGGPGGRPANVYGPALTVRRDQMASFIARAFGAIFSQGVCEEVYDYFDDDNGVVHELCIDGTTDMGITQGTTAGGYNPAGSVSRAQMSGFIMRLMDILVEREIALTPSERSEGGTAVS